MSEQTHLDFTLKFLESSDVRRPETPRYSWDGYLLSGFEEPTKPVFDLTPLFEDLWQAFYWCHPSLKLSQMTELYFSLNSLNSMNQTKLQPCWENFFQHWGFRHDSDSAVTLKALSLSPKSFQNWVDQKKPSLLELSVINPLSDKELKVADEVLRLFFLKFCEAQLSRSQGVRALEWGFYLLESQSTEKTQDTDWVRFLQNKEPSQFFSSLEKLRFPLRSEEVELGQKAIRELSWPKGLQASLKVRGDETELQIEIKAKSPLELEKRLSSLGELSEKLSVKKTEIWPGLR